MTALCWIQLICGALFSLQKSCQHFFYAVHPAPLCYNKNMKILIVSDTHGDSTAIKKITDMHSDYSIIIHAGDYARDLDFIGGTADKYSVKGNCDNPASPAPERLVITIGRSRIFLTHGHLQNAKGTYSQLVKESKENRADICIFGHTHLPLAENSDGILLINPGSAVKTRSRTGSASYAAAVLDESGDLLSAKIMTLK